MNKVNKEAMQLNVEPHSIGRVVELREQRGPLWGTERSGVMSTAGVREHRRCTGPPQVGTGEFQGEWCQPFYMIPLERWNVERKVTSAVKGTSR